MILTLAYFENLEKGRLFALPWGTMGKYVLFGLILALNVGFVLSTLISII